MFLLSVQELRSQGRRLGKGSHSYEGTLRSTRRGSSVAMELYSNYGGIRVLGPLYDPRIVKANEEAMLVVGFEKIDDQSFVQEWLIFSFPYFQNQIKPISEQFFEPESLKNP